MDQEDDITKNGINILSCNNYLLSCYKLLCYRTECYRTELFQHIHIKINNGSLSRGIPYLIMVM